MDDAVRYAVDTTQPASQIAIPRSPCYPNSWVGLGEPLQNIWPRFWLLAAVTVVVLAVGTFAAAYLGTTGFQLPDPAPGSASDLIQSRTLITRLLINSWLRDDVSVWLDDHPWPGLWLAGLALIAEWVAYTALVAGLVAVWKWLQDPLPPFLEPLRTSPEESRRLKDSKPELRLLDELAARSTVECPTRQLFGIKGVAGSLPEQLAELWLKDRHRHTFSLFRQTDKVGWLRETDKVGRVDRNISALLLAETASAGLWLTAASLLKALGPGQVRILVVSRDDFADVISSVPPQTGKLLKEYLLRHRTPIVEQSWAEGVAGETKEGRADQAFVPADDRAAHDFVPIEAILSRRRKVETVAVRAREADEDPTAAAIVFEQTPRLNALTKKFATQAERLLDALQNEFGVMSGLRVAVLAAIATQGSVSSEARRAIAIDAGDRESLRRALSQQSDPLDDDESVPAIANTDLARLVFLQAFARMQGADRRDLIYLLDAETADRFSDFLDDLAYNVIERVEPWLAALVGPAEGAKLLEAKAGQSLREPSQLELVFASVMSACWMQPAVLRHIEESGLSGYLRSLAVDASEVIGEGDRRALLRNLVHLMPRNSQLFASIAESPRWLRHRFAATEVVRSLDPQGMISLPAVPEDDPVRESYSAFVLMNDCFEVAELDRPGLERSELTARAASLIHLMDGPEVVDQVMYAWMIYWLMGGPGQSVGDLPEPFLPKATKSLARASTAAASWTYLAQAYTRIIQGPLSGDEIFGWAVYADTGRNRPRTARETLPQIDTEAEEIIAQAQARLTHGDGSVRYAAALLILSYREDRAAVGVLVDALADPTRNRRDDLLVRLVLNGGASAAEALADLFRRSEEEWLTERIFLALLARDDALALSDWDLEAKSSHYSGYAATRRDIVEGAKTAE